MSDDQIPPDHAEWNERAAKHTTPVTTYRAIGELSGWVTRGTGFFLRHNGIPLVVTNTHVLEKYYRYRLSNEEVCVQVWATQGQPGIEKHQGYLLAPNGLKTVELGVVSDYAHDDIALIELTEVNGVVPTDREFLNTSDLDTALPDVGSIVYYRGYPTESAYFSGPRDKISKYGSWFNVRKVTARNDKIIVTENVASYRGKDFEDEDGGVLQGISGSALFSADAHRVVGVVWGASAVERPIVAAPANTLVRLIGEYEKRRRPKTN